MCETYCCDVGSSDEDGEESFYRVGIGSLCGRDPLLVREVIGVLPLHLWGSKLALLRTPLDLDEVVSMDTAAWNGLWGPEHEARRNSALSDVNR